MAWKQDAIYRKRREKWVEALLSGAYKQGRNFLRTHNAFCCMGVACDISSVGRWDSLFGYVAPGSDSMSIMPIDVSSFYGIDRHPVLCGQCAGPLNDVDRASFEEIAMAILFEEEYQRTDADA